MSNSRAKIAPSFNVGRDGSLLRADLSHRNRDGLGITRTRRLDQFVDLAEFQRACLANFHACRDLPLALAPNAVIAFDRYDNSPWGACGCMECNYIKGTDHGTHAASNAFLFIDQYDLREVSGAVHGARWADTHARGRIAVAAFVWKSGIHHQSRFGVDTWLWGGGLKNGQEQIFGLRMGNCTSGFTLFAADAALGMYKDSFHAEIPFSKPYE